MRLSRINKVARARKRLQKQIEIDSHHGGIYAKGLAGEGYKGGYRDALDDVILLLNGATPYRNEWWDE